MRILLIILLFLLTTHLNVTADNKILIYTSSNNLNENNNPDLVIYLPGSGLFSGQIFTAYEHSGLNLYPFTNPTAKYPTARHRNNLIFISYDASIPNHFGSKATTLEFQKDIKQLIKKFNIRNIYIISNSIGTSLALNLASLSDPEIKNKIRGILACFPITDYMDLVKNTKDPKIKQETVQHFYNNRTKQLDLTFIKESSPITYINSLPKNIKIKFIVATEDNIVPLKQSEDYFNKAGKLGKNISMQKVKTMHLSSEIRDTYKLAIEELLK